MHVLNNQFKHAIVDKRLMLAEQSEYQSYNCEVWGSPSQLFFAVIRDSFYFCTFLLHLYACMFELCSMDSLDNCEQCVQQCMGTLHQPVGSSLRYGTYFMFLKCVLRIAMPVTQQTYIKLKVLQACMVQVSFTWEACYLLQHLVPHTGLSIRNY